MNFNEIFIKSLVWHEIGHFCINLIRIDNNNKYLISSIKFKYLENSEYIFSVSCENPEINSYSDLKMHPNQIPLSILNDFAGCVFENTFNRKFENGNNDVEGCLKIEIDQVRQIILHLYLF